MMMMSGVGGGELHQHHWRGGEYPEKAESSLDRKRQRSSHHNRFEESSSSLPWDMFGSSTSTPDCGGGIRSCEELARDASPHHHHHPALVKKTAGMNNNNNTPNDRLVGESSLKALEMRLGAETVDFLTTLKFSSNHSSLHSENSSSHSDRDRTMEIVS